MLRLSRLADYAIVLLACLARKEQETATARALAQETGVPRPTAVRLLKTLSARGLLRSARGRQGGYGLARPPARIALSEVIEAVEGPIGLTECSREDGDCGLSPLCPVEGHWGPISREVRTALGAISLLELAGRPSAGPTSPSHERVP